MVNDPRFRLALTERRGALCTLLVACGLLAIHPVPVDGDSGSLEVDTLFQHRLRLQRDSMLAKRWRPIDPRYLSDYQGYLLGLSMDELGALRHARREGRELRDSVIFRGIVQRDRHQWALLRNRLRFGYRTVPVGRTSIPVGQRTGLNDVSAEELEAIRGIGPVLSRRIVRYRERIQGYAIPEQLFRVYGLDRSVAEKVLEYHPIPDRLKYDTISLNNSTSGELAVCPYISGSLARAIVAHRSLYGSFENLSELALVKGFPNKDIELIALYLYL